MKRSTRLDGARPCAAARRFDLEVCFLALLAATAASAQAGPGSIASPPPQFDVTGFIQAATTDGSRCPEIIDPLLWGGTVTVNGVTMIVPCNTVLQMPASTVSWAMLFPQAGVSSEVGVAPVGTSTAGLNGQPGGPRPGTTGLALADALTPGSAGPYPSFEIRAIGNIVQVPNPVSGILETQYVVGLISPVSQQGANVGFGMINCIDYANSFIYVGGDPKQPCVLPSGAPNGARLQLNDPIGRWGTAHSPEPLFSGDFNNSTIKAMTGFPMCLPRVAPTSVGTGDGGDPQCPAGNRPLNAASVIDPNTGQRVAVDPFLPAGAPLKTFTMRPPPSPAFGIPGTAAINCPGPNCVPAVLPVPPAPPVYPDARYQVPLMVGDYVTYAGTLAKGDVTLGKPDYISVHTLTANLGIYTAPGTKPVYVGVDTILLGTAGTAINTIGEETTTRIFIVGFTTDPTNLVDINAVDVDPCTGEESLRLLGTVDPLTQVVKGRFRFHVLGGKFMPPTREMIIQSEVGTTPATDPFDPLQPGMPVGVANGFGSGQYRLPNFDFIFPENLVPGEPIVPNNFEDLPFLARGSGPLLGSGSLVGQLEPWPGLTAPAKATCVTVGGTTGALPIPNAGPDFVVASGLPETLVGTVIQDPNAGPPAVTWTQTAGPDAHLTPNPNDPMQPTFFSIGIAPGSQLTFQLAVTDLFGTSTSSVNVSVVDPGSVDFLDPAGASAVFKVPKVATKPGQAHRVGTKGGLLSVSAVDSINDRTISLYVMGWGPMEVDPVNGLPSYILKSLGNGGVENAPASVIVRSSRGGEVTIPVRIR